MSFLLDTNVLSEIRKPKRDSGLADWFERVPSQRLFISVLVLGEIRCGIARLEKRDPKQAAVFRTWLTQLTQNFKDRILPVGPDIADCWGTINYPDPFASH
jgi:predicted nucleic acid-binding protein